MPRQPQISIVANNDGFTTGSVGKSLMAVRWRGGESWYVAAVGKAPEEHADEAAATRAFFIALGIKPAGAS